MRDRMVPDNDIRLIFNSGWIIRAFSFPYISGRPFAPIWIDAPAHLLGRFSREPGGDGVGPN